MNEEEIKKEDRVSDEVIETVKYATIEDLSKIKVAIGTILSVDVIEGSDKLLKLSVDLGEGAPRQILSGIKKYFVDPQVLVNTQTTFVVNLAPRKMLGLDSNGMLYAGGVEGDLVLLRPEHVVAPGTPMH